MKNHPDVQNLISHNGNLLATINGQLHIYEHAGVRSGWKPAPTPMFTSGLTATKRAKERLRKVLEGTGARVGLGLMGEDSIIAEITAGPEEVVGMGFAGANAALMRAYETEEDVRICYHPKERVFHVAFYGIAAEDLISELPKAPPVEAPLQEEEAAPGTSPPPAAA
jgi:hypothetical protein